MKKVFFVILAGGCGERLWPLSRKKKPKQLIPFLGKKSLLEQTVDRMQDFKFSSGQTINSENIFVVTNKDQADLVEKIVGKKAVVLSEPESKNTAPAILYSCLNIEKVANQDSVIVVLSADAFIPDKDQFHFYLRNAINYASQKDRIITFGLKPKFATTAYGYIQSDLDSKDENFDCYDVVKFHEKPNKDLAEYYVLCDDLFWNIGIFVARLEIFLDEFKKHQPSLFEELKSGSYEKVKKISVDYAILEKSERVAVFPADFDWYDVGNLNVFLSLQEEYLTKNADIINIDSHNNLVSTNKKLTVFIGVDDLCLVDTKDVILVSKREDAEKVKGVIPLIEKNFLKELL